MTRPEGERDDEAAGFVARWSRRKQEAAAQRPAPADPGGQAEPQAPPPTDADMPPIESLTEHSEYRGFLSPGVSEELRRVALRKLFHGPLCSVRDGLDDYDDDYTGLARLGDLVTAEMRHRMAREAERLAGRAAAPGAADGATAAQSAAPSEPADAARPPPEPDATTEEPV
jgi:hypothetical protein